RLYRGNFRVGLNLNLEPSPETTSIEQDGLLGYPVQPGTMADPQALLDERLATGGAINALASGRSNSSAGAFAHHEIDEQPVSACQSSCDVDYRKFGIAAKLSLRQPRFEAAFLEQFGNPRAP